MKQRQPFNPTRRPCHHGTWSFRPKATNSRTSNSTEDQGSLALCPCSSTPSLGGAGAGGGGGGRWGQVPGARTSITGR